MSDPPVSGLWDVIVVGAGPAGAMAAFLLAKQGRRVLLVEKASFPREKVCGCCLGARGARLLREHGLGDVLEDAAALCEVEIRHRGHALRRRIPAGYAISRAALDNRLVQAAISAGAVFRPQTSARLLPRGHGRRRVELTFDGRQAVPESSLVLACDGVHGTLLNAEEGCEWEIARNAWMGVSASVKDPSFPSPAGVIAMHVGRSGYVGSVRLGDGTLHFAAALQPLACKRQGGPVPAMQQILEASGAGRCAKLDFAKPKGTPLLTRQRSRYGSHRALAVGDACAYIEPFTGEGMTWALESAALLALALPNDLHTWAADMPDRWGEIQKRALAVEQRLCRAMRFVLHRPALMEAAMLAARALPSAIEKLALTLDRPIPILARSWS